MMDLRRRIGGKKVVNKKYFDNEEQLRNWKRFLEIREIKRQNGSKSGQT